MTPFTNPPAEPLATIAEWFEDARATGAREPGVLALATADRAGRVSNRIVQTIRITGEGLVFTSHAGSGKGRDIEATGWSSGVLYWRESGRQVILTGPTAPLSADESDRLWYARPIGTHPMSVAAEQSAPLDDEEKLRAEAERLAEPARALPRPERWLGYHLTPTTVEFWQSAPDRLHRRLRYDRTDTGWDHVRLQP
ncbi:phenazine biosynthesis FMN-dependent oxidase PhzG [Actinophytocola gossypii]|uniref:Phenazine biosynthesis FMN-dependent oxidase PhzG n=1 Tax=Actinophytocola gossypii TaxID=2812003 RepID=A0ABT2J3R6_9PSEU|nr:phenazine biosynthesis FMN-dependent oxidase PhzG [Actinophytocola gossypii]MCT2581949.1 phenazine biosynthesis FMN-dependent oxidase PhzG [Actinophytocola gossypii]